MGACRTGLGHGLFQAQRLFGATHQREVFDEALEGLLRHHVGTRIAMPRRHEMALGDVDEGVLLQAPRRHALGAAVVENAGIAQVVLGAIGQVTHLHAASQAQQRHQ